VYPGQSAPIPISFWTGRGIVEAEEATLAALQAAGGNLYITVGPHALDGDEGQALVEGLQRLAQYDIDVYLAVVATDYLSVPVHDEWIASVQRIAGAIQREDLSNVRGIIGDAEHPKNGGLDILGLDRKDFFQASRDLDGLIQWARHEHPGLSLGVTALWTLHLDRVDRDADLSIIHRSSVEPPGHWNFVNVMTYSSYIPVSWRAYYVYLIELVMENSYPELPPSHLLGLVDAGRQGEPILDYGGLVRDARLSRAMGVPEVVIFRLNDRVLEQFGESFVRRLASDINEMPTTQAVEIPFSRPASMLIYGTLLADAVLDARGSLAWLFLGWVALSGLLTYFSSHKDLGARIKEP